MELKSKSSNFIIVVGASAGGLHGVVELSAQLPADLNAAVFVVIHMSHSFDSSSLIKRIGEYSGLRCKIAEHGEMIQMGYLYLAVSDKHLLVKDEKILLARGPVENRWRPSIDTLFRSAAAAYNSRVIGVILSSLLQGGTAGMTAIKKSGGTCIVQYPAQAEYPDMPNSVLENVAVDYCVPLHEIGTIIKEATKDGIPKPHIVPQIVKAESEIAERTIVDMDILKDIGTHTVFTCPDCGGGLWQLKNDNFTRYRCHTGHVYTQEEFERKHKEALESTLWVALRMLEERKQLMEKMSREETSKGWIQQAERKMERAIELKSHIDRLKQLLFDAQD